MVTVRLYTDLGAQYICIVPTAGADANGAVIHYSAVKETCKTVHPSSMLLIDSGGTHVGTMWV